jgi:hypothetical protein
MRKIFFIHLQIFPLSSTFQDTKKKTPFILAKSLVIEYKSENKNLWIRIRIKNFWIHKTDVAQPDPYLMHNKYSIQSLYKCGRC